MSDSPIPIASETIVKNAERELKRLWRAYDDAVEVNRRFVARTNYVLAANATVFGLIGDARS